MRVGRIVIKAQTYTSSAKCIRFLVSSRLSKLVFAENI